MTNTVEQVSGLAIYEAERRSKICIVGFADSKRHAPWQDTSWSFWGVNDLYAHVPRVDVIFEIHHTMNMGNRRNPDHEKVLAGGGKRGTGFEIGAPLTPIFVQTARPEWPTSISFPRDKVMEELGSDYFTNSVSWMIALAILELTEIKKVNGRDQRVAKPGTALSVCGVSMAADSEYVQQRPNVEYWVGRAESLGIEVYVPDDAHILKAATLYGYDTSSPLRVRLQADKVQMQEQTIQLMQKQGQLQSELQMVQSQLEHIRGMKSYIDTLVRNLTISTEIEVGSKEMGPHKGRDTILTLEDGKLIESLVVPPSDSKLQGVQVG
jgi:hypothetical protein